MRAIQLTEFGGPEVLRVAEIPDPVPPPDGRRVLLDVEAAGVNYADTHAVENSYLSLQSLPLIPGSEVLGRLPDGRRVCGFTDGSGGYAEKALVRPADMFEVGEEMPATTALSLLVQGLTAWHLLRTSGRMRSGESVVVHAAAGGVGSLAVQLARLWGAGTIVATASTPDKRDTAVDLGADIALDPEADDLADSIRAATGGKGADIVLEMVGGAVFDASLAALGRFGRLVTYGMASRQPGTPVAPGSLMVGSHSVIGFWLMDAVAADPVAGVAGPFAELRRLIDEGLLRPLPGHSYPLAAARQAHEDLRGRATTGKVVLTMNGD
ncbi:MAG: NADPH:quinone oxidoreductase family protein [Actinobacteria bacterium]|nr:NADPH:quinone oxidoreductase family protein [Actinomycetota bacterium]